MSSRVCEKANREYGSRGKNKIRIWSILNFLLWSLLLAKKETQDWNTKKKKKKKSHEEE